MKKFLFLLIPILVLNFSIFSFADEPLYSQGVVHNFYGASRTLYSNNPFVKFGFLHVGGYMYRLYAYNSASTSQVASFSFENLNVNNNTRTLSSGISQSLWEFVITGVDVSNCIHADDLTTLEGLFISSFSHYDDELTLSPKMLYGLNFIKLFLGKSSRVDSVDITIQRVFDDDRPTQVVYTNTYSDNNPYIEFWDDFNFPTVDIPHISYKMYLVPHDTNGSYGNTYIMDFRLRYNDISGVWKYDIDIPTLTHGGGGHERVPIEGINDYTITTIDPTNDTIISSPRTFYSPSISNTYIEENDNSTEIYNYITNNYITESPQPIVENTNSVPTSTSFDFPTLAEFLNILKGIFSLIKNLFEMFINAISNLLGQFTFLPPWFIIAISSLIGIALSVMVWLFVKNLIL